MKLHTKYFCDLINLNILFLKKKIPSLCKYLPELSKDFDFNLINIHTLISLHYLVLKTVDDVFAIILF